MAWTSHAFHVLKDLQTFAAALVAFAAAGLTFYSQKRTSDRQAETAITTLKLKEKQERTLTDEATHRFRIAYLVKLSVAVSDLRIKISFRSQQADLFARSAPEGNLAGTYAVTGVDIPWTVLVSYTPLVERHKVVSPSMSEIERVPASVQKEISLLQLALSDIDSLIFDMVSFGKQYKFVLESHPHAIRHQCLSAIALIENAENGLEAELKAYGIEHTRMTRKVDTMSILDPASPNYRQDIADGMRAARDAARHSASSGPT